jgi:hypothetical protein
MSLYFTRSTQEQMELHQIQSLTAGMTNAQIMSLQSEQSGSQLEKYGKIQYVLELYCQSIISSPFVIV